MKQKLSIIINLQKKNVGWGFRCTACDAYHILFTDIPDSTGSVYELYGSLEIPTIIPDQYLNIKGSKDKADIVCHFNIKNGVITYHDDCTHIFAGLSLDLPDALMRGKDKYAQLTFNGINISLL